VTFVALALLLSNGIILTAVDDGARHGASIKGFANHYNYNYTRSV